MGNARTTSVARAQCIAIERGPVEVWDWDGSGDINCKHAICRVVEGDRFRP
jgi:hypothetical protein